jgi:hypothetical protein
MAVVSLLVICADLHFSGILRYSVVLSFVRIEMRTRERLYRVGDDFLPILRLFSRNI